MCHHFRCPRRCANAATCGGHDRNRRTFLTSYSFFPGVNDVRSTQPTGIANLGLRNLEFMIRSEKSGEQGYHQQGRENRKPRPVQKESRSGKKPGEYGQQQQEERSEEHTSELQSLAYL